MFPFGEYEIDGMVAPPKLFKNSTEIDHLVSECATTHFIVMRSNPKPSLSGVSLGGSPGGGPGVSPGGAPGGDPIGVCRGPPRGVPLEAGPPPGAPGPPTPTVLLVCNYAQTNEKLPYGSEHEKSQKLDIVDLGRKF